MRCQIERASFSFSLHISYVSFDREIYFVCFTTARFWLISIDIALAMVYRDRQEGPPPGDPMSTAHHHDHYLDNCFLLCLNRDDQTDVPEIHRLENHLLRDLCQSHPVNKSPSQQQSRRYVPDQRRPMPEKNEFDEYPYDERNASPRYPKENDPVYRRKDNQADHYP